MRSCPSSRCGLFVISVLLLALAYTVRDLRHERSSRNVTLMQFHQYSQHCSALLVRAFYADNFLTYSALSDTTATYGNQKMQAVARIVRTPESMSISYLSGDARGRKDGYNMRWFWRQVGTGPLEPYAEMRRNASEMSTRRFVQTLDNYATVWRGQKELGGRRVDVLELWPFHPADGARGPGKRLWIDEQTGLTLRTETFNYKMIPVMTSTLSHLDLSPAVQPAALTLAAPDASLAHPAKDTWVAQEMGDDFAQVERDTSVSPPRPAYLPPGFAFDSVGVHRYDAAAGSIRAALARYSDGLNTLTVFAMKTKLPPAGRPSPHASSCYFGAGTLVIRDTPQVRFIAVADLPPPVLQRVLISIPLAAADPHSH